MKNRSRLDAIANWFRPAVQPPAEERASILLSRERFGAAQAIVTAFYATLLFFAVSDLYAWQQFLEVTALNPRWPVFWLRFVPLELGIRLVLWLYLFGGLIGVALCRFRWARIAAFLALLEFLSFKFSFGSINHGDHLGVLLAFVLIFLPAGWRSPVRAPRRVRVGTLLVISGCQGMILLIYTMSGMWKAGGVVEQLIRGQWITYLAPSGLAQQIAAKLLEDETTTILGPWLIEHYWLGWPLMLAALYLELFALWALFRPSLHAVFGSGLIALHVSTHLTMGVGFAQNSLWLALFLVASPLRPVALDWRAVVAELPLFGALAIRTPQSNERPPKARE